MLVVDLLLALLIPVLRRDHIHLRSHLLHPARRLIPKAARLIAHHHLLGHSQLLAQPQGEAHPIKPRRGLWVALIDLTHHPVVPLVHVDRNLDSPSSLRYCFSLSVHVVECGVFAAHSTTHDHLHSKAHRVYCHRSKMPGQLSLLGRTVEIVLFFARLKILFELLGKLRI